MSRLPVTKRLMPDLSVPGERLLLLSAALIALLALLPIFARDILETGPWGLGLLRSAPAIGAPFSSVTRAFANGPLASPLGRM